MKFSTAILKLTAFYVLIIMVISVGFSVAIYRISSSEIGRGLGTQSTMLHNMPRIISDGVLDDFENLRRSQINESLYRLQKNLAYFNLFILVLSAVGSYFFARWTLQPLEEALEEQKRFTADASHELKTPLSAIRSEIEVSLRDKKFNSVGAKKLLKSNLEEIEKLETLSGALLKLAKFDEENRLEFLEVKLGDIISEAYEKVESLAAKKSIEFSAKLVDAKILGDRQSLIELFVILFDNAIKYSPRNSKIKISLSVVGKSAIVSIKDRGIGILARDLPHIFDRFYRADQSRGKNHIGGFGLGLSIAKRIAELHGGTISASSVPGKGSEFIVKF